MTRSSWWNQREETKAEKKVRLHLEGQVPMWKPSEVDAFKERMKRIVPTPKARKQK